MAPNLRKIIINMDKKTALIVGGSRGIGRACALSLAEAGFDIWLTYKGNHEAASATRKEIEALGRSCETMAFDIADYEATKAALEEKADQNPPEAVVFNAGVARDNLMVWMTREEWDTVLSTNLDGFYNVIRSILFPMLRAKNGRIVIISSISGQIGETGQVNYSASKAGLIGAGKALAKEIGKKKILVNIVAPGIIETDMTADVDFGHLKKIIPLQRFGQPEDVASIVKFLCTEPNMYIHGQVIGVNGGLAT